VSTEQRTPPPPDPLSGKRDLGDARLTEKANPRTATIDHADALEIVRLLQAEDRSVPDAVAGEAPRIAAMIREVARRMRCGGRLFYVGAGTSGRLGVLDAAECPPTFGTDPEMVRGIIAGGHPALVRSEEGVEDDADAGRAAIRSEGVRSHDFVLGIAASSTTPFVQAALEEAVAAGAGTGFLCCTPPPPHMVDLVDLCVIPLVGPEAIAGSTRLKAGTATKLVLNALTTGVMIRLGKVYGNLMVDLRAVSEKLADRSLRIVSAVTGAGREEARRLLVAAGGSAKTAIAMRRMGVDRWLAERRLDACDGSLAAALERFPPSSPVRNTDIYPESGSAEDLGLLLERLATGPGRLVRAVEAAPDGPGERTARHVAHVVAFETEAIRPRLEALAAADGGSFPGWEDESWWKRKVGDTKDLLTIFAGERQRTLGVLDEAGQDIFERGGSLGVERFTVYQLLRGAAHHDEAHASRISERVHPGLQDRAVS
jgi:N-acetylmuramic acid 6-phosphate etherase